MKKPNGTRLNRGKLMGMRVGKNTRSTDICPHYRRNKGKAGKTHTSPVVFVRPEDDGHLNPARIRHAITKARHHQGNMGS